MTPSCIVSILVFNMLNFRTNFMKKDRKPRVRYSHALSKKITSLIESKMTITKICELPDMPDRRTVHRWRHDYPKFDAQMALSERIRLSFLVDEMIDLTEGGAIDYLVNKLSRKPDKQELYEEITRRRLRVDTIKFLSAKLYGTKNYDVEVNNVDKVVNVVNYQSLKPVEGISVKQVPDLQPQSLKPKSLMTPAQLAQLNSRNNR